MHSQFYTLVIITNFQYLSIYLHAIADWNWRIISNNLITTWRSEFDSLSKQHLSFYEKRFSKELR